MKKKSSLTIIMKFYYSTDWSSISTERKNCATQFAKNHSSTNIIKNLVYIFETCYTVSDHPQSGHCKVFSQKR